MYGLRANNIIPKGFSQTLSQLSLRVYFFSVPQS